MPDHSRNQAYNLLNASITLCHLNYVVRSVQACDTSSSFDIMIFMCLDVMHSGETRVWDYYLDENFLINGMPSNQK